MSALIDCQNYGPGNIKDTFQLDADVAAGSSSFILKNNAGAAVGDPIIFGNLGDEGSEKLTIATVNADNVTITTSTTSKLIHKRYEPVNTLFGDSINLYRATNVTGELPADSNFAIIGTTPTATIDYDELTTSINDSTGSNLYWYKFTYYNSSSSAETQLADSSSQRGASYGHYATLQEILEEAGLQNNPNIAISKVETRRIEAEQLINGELYNTYTLPFAVPVPAPISLATKQIAAGLLLLQEYGPMASGNKTHGQDKYDEGITTLEKIKARETTLLDPAGNSLLLQPLVTSYPNITTDQTGTGRTVEDVAATDQDFGPVFRKVMRF